MYLLKLKPIVIVEKTRSTCHLFSYRMPFLRSPMSQDEKGPASINATFAAKAFPIRTSWKDTWESTPAKSRLHAQSVHLQVRPKTISNTTAVPNTKWQTNNISEMFTPFTPKPLRPLPHWLIRASSCTSLLLLVVNLF
jgi:hypothetical protein